MKVEEEHRDKQNEQSVQPGKHECNSSKRKSAGAWEGPIAKLGLDFLIYAAGNQ